MERITKIFENNRVQKVLNLSCGTGGHLIYLSKKGFETYGFDASPKGISLARQWLAEENLKEYLQLHRMDEDFPYEDNLFDAIDSIKVIHHNKMKEILKMITEIERVLKKRGLIFITFPKLSGSRGDISKMEKIEDGTYILKNGKEKGLPHHFFIVEEINDIFSSFKLTEIYMDGKNHRAVLGFKKQRI